MQPHHRAHFTSHIDVADFLKNTSTYATFNPGLFIEHFQKTQGKKNSASKKLEGIFGQKTQCIGIFEALSNKLSVLEFFEASFSPLF